MTDAFRAWLREIADRWRGYGQCWRCLEWHHGSELREIELRGWLCKECRK